jgi:hypothetical protein
VIEPALAVRYADTSPESLSLSLDDPARPALAELHLTLCARPVTLRLLGASHQVEVGGGAILRETVACSERACEPLPTQFVADDYRFTSETTQLDPTTLVTRVAELRRTLADDPRAIVGHYPGDPDAVTAVQAAETSDGIGWRTWHSYPQTGQIVTTTTRLRWGAA